MDKVFSERAAAGLVWLPEIGMGYYPVHAADEPYDAEYFAKYREMADTRMGRSLTAARIAMVRRHYAGPLLDVGIGSGHFVENRPNTWGYDVNPAGVQWLSEQGAFLDLYVGDVPAATFWDSLEHIPDPAYAVQQVREWVFVALPVFDGAEHCLNSKHFRKTEHRWYWTPDGFSRWMTLQGFREVERNYVESEIGREGIASYAFRRVACP